MAAKVKTRCLSTWEYLYFIRRQCAAYWYANMGLHEVPSVCVSYLSLLFVTSKVLTRCYAQIAGLVWDCLFISLQSVFVILFVLLYGVNWGCAWVIALCVDKAAFGDLPCVSYEENNCVWVFVRHNVSVTHHFYI